MNDETLSGGAAAAPVFPESAPASGPRRFQVEFTGTGSEYFRIWIVNLLLTILTLGIYSAWAKVRKMQYFYRNTRVDGSVFDYHGRPVAILKGRLIVLALVFGYNIALQFSLMLGLLMALALAGAMPWLLAQSQRFRLHNSSYRGLRFRFLAGPRELYLILGVPLLLTAIWAVWFLSAMTPGRQQDPTGLIGLLLFYVVFFGVWPWVHYRFKRYQHMNSAYGQTRGEFAATPGGFYKVYLKALGLGVLLIAGIGGAVALMTGAAAFGRGGTGAMIASILFLVAIYALLLAIGPYVMARLQNLIWNHTRLGPIGFDSRVKARRLAWIVITNLLLIAITIGLFTPFAAVRSARYKLQSVTLLADDDLASFVGAAGADVPAVGEGAADLFDVDFAL